jgi:hypothetical protein
VQIEETHARANQIRLDYMSIDEVRAEEGLLPLPDGAGEWKDAPEGLQLFNQKGAPNDPKNPEDPNVKEDPLKEQLRDSDMFITFVPKPKYPIRRKTLSQDAGEAEGSWVTINGVHILIKEGETAASAFERTTGKKLEGGSGGGETKTINTPSNQVGSGEKMFSPEITNVISAWKSEGANPPTEIGNGVETLSFEQFSNKYPDAKITRVGKFGLEAEVSGTDRHGAKFTDLYSAYASRETKTINTPSNQVGSGEKMDYSKVDYITYSKMSPEEQGEVRAYQYRQKQQYGAQFREEGYNAHGEVLQTNTTPKTTGFTRNSTPTVEAFKPTEENFKVHFGTLSERNKSIVTYYLSSGESEKINAMNRGSYTPSKEELEKWTGVIRSKVKFVWQ